MQKTDLPANVSLLVPDDRYVQTMKPCKVLDIFDGGSTNFHEDGLFSISTFGRVGSEDRDLRFSFIDLRTEILHPYIYKNLVKLKGMYADVMAGKAYAVWDEELKELVASDAISGRTGYGFFLENWKKIVFKGTGSDIRDMRITLLQKFKDKATTKRVLVLPAGLRDATIEADGSVKQGDINEFYRSLISISNTITNDGYNTDSRALDNARYSLQKVFNNIFQYINDLLEGKGGFLNKKWGARRVFNGTRNVITAMDTTVEVLDERNSPDINQTQIGLFQLMKGALPKTHHYLLTGWLSKVFQARDGKALLVNPKTLHSTLVDLDSTTIDKWTTSSGLDKVINAYSDNSIRSKPVLIKGHYVGLVYRGPDMTFKLIHDIDELPKELKKEHVHPISLCELMYLSGYRFWNDLGMFITRYPIGQGHSNIYSCFAYVKNTIVGEMRYELGDDWQKLGDDFVALEYPILEGLAYVDTLIPHTSRIAGMVGDYDGDTASANIIYTDDGIEEIRKVLNKTSAYKNTRHGGFLASVMVETVERVIYNLTGD